MKFELAKYREYFQLVFYLLMATTVPLFASFIIGYIYPL